MDESALMQTDTIERVREDAIAPPYVSFNTFRTLLNWLRSEGVPLQFDRSFWQAKFSGSTGTQLVAALRFLGLIQGDRPLEDMESLVEASPDERRFIIAVLLKDSYVAVPFDELERATPAMVKGWFRAYPIDGHTMRKAVSFFVNAAKAAELPMSNAVRKMAKSKRPSPSGGSSMRDKTTAGEHTTDERHKTLSGERPGRHGGRRSVQGSQTTVHLASGGTVGVDLDVDLFHLSEGDREFVLRLIDLTKSYQEGGKDPPDRSIDDIGGPTEPPTPGD